MESAIAERLRPEMERRAPGKWKVIELPNGRDALRVRVFVTFDLGAVESPADAAARLRHLLEGCEVCSEKGGDAKQAG